MTDNNLKLYIHASARQKGALGITNVYADEEKLSEGIDRRVQGIPKNSPPKSTNLPDGDLRHGWLIASNGEAVDEIMLAKPFSGMRVIMTHGGEAVRAATDAFLREAGFHPFDEPSELMRRRIESRDKLLDFLLLRALTESQVAAILRTRADGCSPESIIALNKALTTRRILLTGPPNAGKSSLLNHLAGFERAFVHPEAGATRDVVDELIDLGGHAVLIGDMPGFSSAHDDVGHMVWEKAAARLRTAEVIFFVVDGAASWDEEKTAAARAIREAMNPEARTLVILNKMDMPFVIKDEPWAPYFSGARHVRVCALPEGNAGVILDREAHMLLGGMQ